MDGQPDQHRASYSTTSHYYQNSSYKTWKLLLWELWWKWFV